MRNFLVMLMGFTALGGSPAAGAFADWGLLPPGYEGWRGPAELRMVAFGILEEEIFSEREEEALSRGAYIHHLVSALGEREAAELRQGEASFDDVAPGSRYAGSLALAKELGIATGDESGRFFPARYLTLTEALVFLARAIEMEESEAPFPESLLLPALDMGVLGEQYADQIRVSGEEPTTLREALELLDRFFYYAVVPSRGSTVYQDIYSPAPPTLEISSPAEGEALSPVDHFHGHVEVAGSWLLPAVLRLEFEYGTEETIVRESGAFSFVSSHPGPAGEKIVVLSLRDLAGRLSTPMVRSYGVELPIYHFSRDALDFGEQELGSSSPVQVVELINEGPTVSQLGFVLVDDGFEVRAEVGDCGGGTQLLPGENCHIRIAFTPKQEGAHSGLLEVSRAHGSVPVLLTGMGVSVPGAGGSAGGGGGEGGEGDGGGVAGAPGRGGSGGTSGPGHGGGFGGGSSHGGGDEDAMAWPEPSCGGCAAEGGGLGWVGLALAVSLIARRRRG